MRRTKPQRKKLNVNARSKNKQKTNDRLLLSLFCGAGGLDCGFEEQNFEIGLACDIREESIQSYNHNRKHKVGHVKDISSLKVKDLDALYGKQFNPIGIIGGPPCQGFSVSNVNKKKRDKRNQLSFAYADLLGELNKRSPVHFFVFENVKGLLGAKHKNEYSRIRKAFEKNGFKIFSAMLNAVNYQVPQKRERLIMVGLNRKLYPDATWSAPAGTKEFLSVRDVIGALPPPVFFNRSLKVNEIPHHQNHWCMTPKSSKFSKKVLIQGQSFGRSFRTIEWEKPSPTVAYGHREVHVHPDGKRRLSVYEAMKLQGFPQDYILLGTLSQQITQVSEAVPPPFANQIAASIVDQLLST